MPQPIFDVLSQFVSTMRQRRDIQNHINTPQSNLSLAEFTQIDIEIRTQSVTHKPKERASVCLCLCVRACVLERQRFNTGNIGSDSLHKLASIQFRSICVHTESYRANPDLLECWTAIRLRNINWKDVCKCVCQAHRAHIPMLVDWCLFILYWIISVERMLSSVTQSNT